MPKRMTRPVHEAEELCGNNSHSSTVLDHNTDRACTGMTPGAHTMEWVTAEKQTAPSQQNLEHANPLIDPLGEPPS